MRALLAALALVGCGEDDAPPPLAETPSVETGDCDIAVGDAGGPAGVEVLYASEHGWFTNRAFSWSEVIRDDGPYAALQSDLQVSLPSVDFSTTLVVAVWESRETCDFAINTAAAYSISGGYHLEVEFDDLSGGCSEPCEAPGGALVVISFPYLDSDPTICRRTWDACAG